MPETDSDTDPMKGAGAEDTRTERQRMFEISKELHHWLVEIGLGNDIDPGELNNAIDQARTLSLYLKEQAK
jgi:hypothetical protein